MDRSVWRVIKCLATSRKVWVAVIGAIGAIVLYLQGVLDAEKLASALVALATAVIVAIAAEDSAEKIGGTYIEGWPECDVCGDPAEAVTADGWYCKEHAPDGALPVVIQ